MRRDASSPEAYRADVEAPQREILERLRELLLEAVPDVTETIGHGMLDYPGLANLGAQKHYVALYVAPQVLQEHIAEFPGVDHGKSCLRFRKLEQVDRDAVLRLLRAVRAHRAAQG